jgi:neutral trehalase
VQPEPFLKTDVFLTESPPVIAQVPVYSRIVGTGSALPERCVDNATLSAELALQAAEEKKRLDTELAAPSLEELEAAQTDGSDAFDYSATRTAWEATEGSAQAVDTMQSTYTATKREVDALRAELDAAGRLDELDAIPGYVPPEGEGDPQYAAIWAEAMTAA